MLISPQGVLFGPFAILKAWDRDTLRIIARALFQPLWLRSRAVLDYIDCQPPDGYLFPLN